MNWIKGLSCGQGWRRAATIAALGWVLGLTGCATHYVDANVKEVPVASYRKPAEPRPVQLIFEFQTKGALNTRATDLIKKQVAEQVAASGLFARASETPVEGGGLLSIAINNVSLSDDAFSKGFVTGLTFGLAGSTVADGYVCTVKYFPAGRTEPIVKTARHALYTSMGATPGPANAIKVDKIETGIRTVVRQVVSHVLNDLSQDPEFK